MNVISLHGAVRRPWLASAYMLLLLATSTLAQEPPKRESSNPHAGHTEAVSPPDEHSEHIRTSDRVSAEEHGREQAKPIEMGAMQGGRSPTDARDPHVYAEGFEYTGIPGMEKSDQLKLGYLLADEFEGISGNEGDGYAWSVQGNYGDDRNKLWLRTQGLKVPGELDPTTSGEVLWWRSWTAFFGTQLGVRQDFGSGAHTYLAAGIEGLAPYWFEIEATAYAGEDGRLSARLKASYDILFSNRLILTPNLEANLYSKAEEERALGSGLGNVEGGLRLRYEFSRKVALYVGYVWERSFGDTADRRRAEGDPVNEHRVVAGIRMWW